MDPQEAARRSDHGITPPLEQEEPPTSDPGPQNRPVEGDGSLRPISKLQERDDQTHRGHPERPPFDLAAPSDTMGLRHVELALEDLEFPMTTAQLRRIAGRWRMPTTGRHFHLLEDYLADLDADRKWSSAGELVRAVGKKHRNLVK